MLSRLMLEIGQVPRATSTLETYLTSVWLPAVEDRVRRRTVEEYRSKCELYIIPVLGSTRLSDLEPYALDRWLAGLADRGLAPRTRLHAYRVLGNALNQAVRWRMIPTNPLMAVTAPTVERATPDTLSETEARLYLEAFTGHPLEPAVVLGIAGGLRRSEIAALDWSDVDFAAGTVTVSKGLHERAGEVWVEPPKSAMSSRVVALPKWAMARLKAHRAIGPLLSERGTRMRPNRISTLYERHVCEWRAPGSESKLRRVPIKQLRHTMATIALASGVNIAAVSRRMGHSGIAITDLHYLAPGRDADDQAAAALEHLGLGDTSAQDAI